MGTELRTLDAGPERSFGALIQDVGASVDRLVRAELRMAVAEARAEVVAVGGAAMTLAVGAIVATLSAVFLLLAAVAGLTRVLPTWAAALVVGGAVGVVAIVLVTRAVSRLSGILAQRPTELERSP